jgi:hypothetical protein
MHRIRFSFLATFFLLAALVAVPAKGFSQAFPPVWSNTATYAGGDLVTDYGNIYRCIKDVTTPYLDPSKTYANWELYFVRNNTTIVIGTGQPFPSLTTAWTYSKNATIAQGAYLHLTISTANGDYAETMASPFSLDHPFGASISILGDHASKIKLTFSFIGFTLDSGHALGALSNVTLKGPGGDIGLQATTGATMASVSGVEIDGFLSDVNASVNASITFSNLTISNSNTQGQGITCSSGATIYFQTAESLTGTGASGSIGIFAIDGGRVVAESFIISHWGTGIQCWEGGYVDAYTSYLENCSIGIDSELRGFVDDNDGSFTSNTDDVECRTGGGVAVLDVTLPDGTYVDSGTGAYIMN